ncbi:MAG: VirB3 family type IV secretion system protein [Alphaproteobacteria bacterium]|jgi:type IV secretion system protein VirB3|nr:VirB3 family type IV secretion system protein [Candidatus Jidaibacter sp.]
MSDDNKVTTDPLFVGLTRPPMLFGVSYLFALFNGFVCMIGYIIATDFRFLMLMFPIHMLGYYLCAKEPLFIELFRIRATKCMKSRNRFYHGANSYDPN